MTAMVTRTYKVPAMSCDHCVQAITKEVSPLDGVTGVSIDLDTKIVTVEGGADQAIVDAIGEAGFDVDEQ